MELNVTLVQPEAQAIVAQAAAIYIKHTQPWFIGLIAHGSAVKGGFIPGCSDIDLQLYLEDPAFSEDGLLPFELCGAIHRDLAQIDHEPFQYIQCLALGPHGRDGVTGPIPGAYQVVAGRLPIPEASARVLYDGACAALTKLATTHKYFADALLTSGGGNLERKVRLICTDVWPVMYHVLAIQQNDPVRTWGLPKTIAIGLLPEEQALGQALRAFEQALRSYYTGVSSVEAGLAVIERGAFFLRTVKEWWRHHEGHE